jgi:hypothetical protein
MNTPRGLRRRPIDNTPGQTPPSLWCWFQDGIRRVEMNDQPTALDTSQYERPPREYHPLSNWGRRQRRQMSRDKRQIAEQLNGHISRGEGDWALSLPEEIREYRSNLRIASCPFWALAGNEGRRGLVKRADDKLEVSCFVRLYESLNGGQGFVLQRLALTQPAAGRGKDQEERRRCGSGHSVHHRAPDGKAFSRGGRCPA